MVLIAGGVACYFIFGNKKAENKVEQPSVSEEEREQARQAERERIRQEAAQMGQRDTTYQYEGVVMEHEAAPVQDDGGALAVITVKEGDRLASLAKQYYGDRMFWVYIYRANQDKLKSPNNLAVGMTLIVPKINVDSEETRAEATRLEREYLGR